ncbi:TMEM43 family protein [Dyella japonica]|uniref:Uncharacterized protein n=1 Tax=Dyella japonica A8 TaxID=1217721 RepID=A0A075K037_9GAMM|nr:TMEM43 family protein [Dyella japonica]AIF47185.1 hypothetical protein HY57_07805 [Dyella japonica A8]
MQVWVRRVLGILLLLAGAGMVFLTEQGVLDNRHASDRHGGQIVDVEQGGAPEQARHGDLVRVSGPVHVVQEPYDPEFGQHAHAPVLIRHVEMFQWREIRVGGVVHYEQDWVDRPVDSRRFAQPSGHANPERFPIEGKQFDAGQAQVGNYTLSPPLLHALPGGDPVTPDGKTLPENLAASFSLNGKYFTTSVHSGQPRLGDLRVSWEAVPSHEVTVFAQVSGNQLVPAASAIDGKGFDVQVGDRRLEDVLPDVPAPPSFAWLRCIMALLMAILGALLLLPERPQTHHDLLLSVGSGTLLVCAVACVMWLGTDMSVGGLWFGGALAGLALAVWRLRVTAR